MNAKLKGWLVVVLLLGTMAYSVAEDITLTTYYPSPRGVYKELRTSGDVKLGDLSGTAPKGRLEIRGNATSTDKALYVGDNTGQARLVVQNDGNVGIGTADPSSLLHLHGVGVFRSRLQITNDMTTAGNLRGGFLSISGNQLTLSNGETNGSLMLASNGIIDLKTGENAPVRINAFGKVGIGTTNPLGLLHIKGTPLLMEWDGGDGPGGILGGPRIYLVDTNLGSVTTAPVWAMDNNGDRFRVFRQPDINTAGFEGFTVTNAGNVGIGTVAPSAWTGLSGPALQMQGTRDTSLRLVAGGIDGGMAIGNVGGTMQLALGTVNSFPLVFATQGAERMRVGPTGDVGIGTSSSNARFYVTDFVNRPVAIFENPFNLATSAHLFEIIGVGGAKRFVIDGTGKVGIGAATPTTTLDVAGDLNISGCYENRGTNIYGTCVSDIRLKSNVRPLTTSLERLLQLRPVQFELHEPGAADAGRVQEGLIAQEVEKIFPEWVTEGADGYKRITYGSQIQMHLLAGLKELYARQEALGKELHAKYDAVREENDALRQEVNALKKRLGALEGQHEHRP